MKEVWPDSFVEEGALSRSVSILRKVFDDSPAEKAYIATVPTRGYRFVAPVTVCHRGEAVIADRGGHIAAVPSDPPPLSHSPQRRRHPEGAGPG